MEAWIQGQKATATVIKPVTVNLTMQHVVQRPRRLKKRDWVPWKPLWPPSCDKADDFVRSQKLVGCLEKKDYVKLRECWQHYRQIHTALEE